MYVVTQLILDRPSTSASTNEALCADLSRDTSFDTITQGSLVPARPEVRCQLLNALMRTDSLPLQLYRTNYSQFSTGNENGMKSDQTPTLRDIDGFLHERMNVGGLPLTQFHTFFG